MSTTQQDLEMRVLEYVHDHTDRSAGTPASLEGLFAEFGEAEAMDTTTDLERQGLVEPERTFEGGFHITTQGRRAVEDLRARRANKGLRRRACRQQLLAAIDNAVDRIGDPFAVDHFAGGLDGLAFTGDEAYNAAHYLIDEGLVRFLQQNAGGTWLTVTITPRGTECVESDLPVAEFLDRGRGSAQSQTITVSGSNNTIAGAVGAGASAQVEVTTIDPTEVRALVDAVRQMAPVLGFADDAELVLVEIESTDDPGLVRRGLANLYLLASQTSTGAAGALLAGYMAHQFGITPGP